MKGQLNTQKNTPFCVLVLIMLMNEKIINEKDNIIRN